MIGLEKLTLNDLAVYAKEHEVNIELEICDGIKKISISPFSTSAYISRTIPVDKPLADRLLRGAYDNQV